LCARLAEQKRKIDIPYTEKKKHANNLLSASSKRILIERLKKKIVLEQEHATLEQACQALNTIGLTCSLD
jgi:hypothetical protein